MLEKPALPDAEIIACLEANYGLRVSQITFLPIGADPHSALYRATTSDGGDYFVKLRGGDFNAMTVVVPKRLHDQGCGQIIPPYMTQSQQLWTTLHHYTLTAFPFIAGDDGYTVTLSAAHWHELGRVLKQMHAAILPAEWAAHLPPEGYSAQWRQQVVQFQTMANNSTFSDPISAELASLLRQQHPVIDQLVSRAAHLATLLQKQHEESPHQHVLCHGDIHAGNVLVTANDHLYIVDWDTLILAPKERDLMFVGGGLFANQRSLQEEEAFFYQGYGPTTVDPIALTYYRCERVVQDIAAYCEQIFLTKESSEDRAVGLRQLASQFCPNDIVDIALHSESVSSVMRF